MATRTNVVFPQIRGGSEVHNSYEVVEQDFDALRVQSPKRRTVYDSYGRPVTPRLEKLEDKVSQALVQQNQVLSQQQQVAQALNDQQKMSENLMDRVYQNREDFLDNLNRVQNDRLEGNTRRLLQDHIRYITAIVGRLNHDISGLEEELRGRDMAVAGTNSAVGKLEVHHVTMLQDLRSRIVRCDSALMKHSSDIRNCYSDINQAIQQQYSIRESLKEQMHRLEAEMLSMTGELERLNGEQRSELIHMKKDTSRDLALLDERNNASLSDVKTALQANRLSLENDMEKFEGRLQSMLEKVTSGWKHVLEKVDQRVQDSLYGMESRMQKLEEAIAYDRDVIANLQTRVETRIINRLDTHTRHHQEELAKAKREFREGFTSVHDSIANAKRVLEGKSQLLEDRLKKDLIQVRKLVVLA